MNASAPHSCAGDVGAAAGGRRAPAPAPQEDTAAAGRTRGGGAGLQGGHHRSCTCCGRGLAASGLSERDGAPLLPMLPKSVALCSWGVTRDLTAHFVSVSFASSPPPTPSAEYILPFAPRNTSLPRSFTRCWLNSRSFLHVASPTESPDSERDSFASHLSRPHAHTS